MRYQPVYTMHTAVLSYQSSQFEFLYFGHGPRAVVCLHGYGEDAGSFCFLEKHLGDDCSFIAINLPHHGNSRWNETAAFCVHDLLLVIEAAFVRAGTRPASFILFGYSMGGRVAMAMAVAFPPRISRLCLVAPVGMKMNGWYWLSTQPIAGNALFRFTMRHPGWLMGSVKAAHRMGLVNTSIGKFLTYYIGDPRVRQELYDRWTCMRRFRPRLHRLQQHIRSYSMPVRLLYGKYDRIIVAARGREFATATGPQCRMVVLAAGHQLLQEKYADAIMTLLLR